MYELSRKAMVKEGDDIGGKRFIPKSKIDAIVTKEAIKTELKKKKKFGLMSQVRAGRVASRVYPNLKRIFLTLIHLGDPWAVEDILNAGFTDNDLPLIQCGSDRILRSSNISVTEPTEFEVPWTTEQVDDFIIKQWRMLAPVIENKEEYDPLDQDCPLPFENLEVQKSDYSSIVYKATMHTEYQNEYKIRNPTFPVALKEFRNSQAFKTERKNLDIIRRLASSNHITKNIGCCARGDRYFIVFPWAEGGDLDNFWMEHAEEKRSSKLIEWSLKQMLGLSEALEALHNQIGEKANCRHGDLKPQNILHFHHDGKNGMLKVSDFGISKVHENDTFQREGQSTSTNATTPSYEAPEALHSGTRSRKYDLWSLGCIFLEFTVWLVQGWEALEAFREERKSKVKDKTWSFFYQPPVENPEVHVKVLQRIATLKSLKRSQPSTALHAVLEIIENGLLRINVNDRLAAKDLHIQLKKIVKQIKTKPAY